MANSLSDNQIKTKKAMFPKEHDFDKTSDGRILVPEDEYYQEAYIKKQREIAKQIELGKLKSYTLEEAQQILEDGHF